MPLHRELTPHQRMPWRDDHHLERQRSAQLTQSDRFFVIHRKLSHGTRSQSGERFTERALSAAGTCRLQHRSLFAYLSDLIAADTRGDPFPQLA
jgi:hypothetical protein